MTDTESDRDTRLVLASSSPYRAALLERLHLPFEQRTPDLDESRAPGEAPDHYVLRLARAKAEAVVARDDPAALVVIGSDQTCVNGDQILGKPGTADAARAQLRAASGREVVFHTGVAVLDRRRDTVACRVVRDRVRFRALDEAAIDAYVMADSPLDTAGAFRVEGYGITLFERVDSTDPTSLVGLPLIALGDLLRDCGYRLP